MRASMTGRTSFMLFACAAWSSGPPIRRRVHFFAIDRNHEGVRHVVTLDAGVAFLDAAHEPPEQLVLAVGGEHVTDQAAAARPER